MDEVTQEFLKECNYVDWDTAMLLDKFYVWLKQKEIK